MTNPGNHLIISLPIVVGYFCLNGILHAGPSRLESNSPFLPPGYSTVQAPPPKPVQRPINPVVGELEFRGVVQFDGIYHFSLFKKSENRGYWISEDDDESEIKVSNFDIDNMIVTIIYNGRSEKLSLVAASENPLPVVANSPPKPPLQGQAPPMPTPPGFQSPENKPKNNLPRRRTIPRRRLIIPPNN